MCVCVWRRCIQNLTHNIIKFIWTATINTQHSQSNSHPIMNAMYKRKKPKHRHTDIHTVIRVLWLHFDLPLWDSNGALEFAIDQLCVESWIATSSSSSFFIICYLFQFLIFVVIQSQNIHFVGMWCDAIPVRRLLKGEIGVKEMNKMMIGS